MVDTIVTFIKSLSGKQLWSEIAPSIVNTRTMIFANGLFVVVGRKYGRKWDGSSYSEWDVSSMARHWRFGKPSSSLTLCLLLSLRFDRACEMTLSRLVIRDEL